MRVIPCACADHTLKQMGEWGLEIVAYEKFVIRIREEGGMLSPMLPVSWKNRRPTQLTGKSRLNSSILPRDRLSIYDNRRF